MDLFYGRTENAMKNRYQLLISKVAKNFPNVKQRSLQKIFLQQNNPFSEQLFPEKLEEDVQSEMKIKLELGE